MQYTIALSGSQLLLSNVWFHLKSMNEFISEICSRTLEKKHCPVESDITLHTISFFTQPVLNLRL